jgi:hypothetical protein
MKFLLAVFVWLLMAVIIGLGIWMVAAKGSVWLLVLSAVAFITMMWRFGCQH